MCWIGPCYPGPSTGLSLTGSGLSPTSQAPVWHMQDWTPLPVPQPGVYRIRPRCPPPTLELTELGSLSPTCVHAGPCHLAHRVWKVGDREEVAASIATASLIHQVSGPLKSPLSWITICRWDLAHGHGLEHP